MTNRNTPHPPEPHGDQGGDSTGRGREPSPPTNDGRGSGEHLLHIAEHHLRKTDNDD
jgi:hypothetical protein